MSIPQEICVEPVPFEPTLIQTTCCPEEPLPAVLYLTIQEVSYTSALDQNGNEVHNNCRFVSELQGQTFPLVNGQTAFNCWVGGNVPYASQNFWGAQSPTLSNGKSLGMFFVRCNQVEQTINASFLWCPGAQGDPLVNPQEDPPLCHCTWSGGVTDDCEFVAAEYDFTCTNGLFNWQRWWELRIKWSVSI